jgi:hypothetical protein
MSWLVEAVLLLSFFAFIYYSEMRRVGPLELRRGRGSVLPTVPANTDSKISSSSRPSPSDGPFYPSMEEVLQVRDILRRVGPRDIGLPDEVVDMIVDDAEYWPSVETKLENTPFLIGQDGDRECLRTAPLCYDVEEQVCLLGQLSFG